MERPESLNINAFSLDESDGTFVAQGNPEQPVPVLVSLLRNSLTSREGQAMEIGDVRSNGLANTAPTDYAESRTENSFFPHLQLPAAGMSSGSTQQAAPAKEVRSVVERRFMSMNEAHDRIRTAMLAPDHPDGE